MDEQKRKTLSETAEARRDFLRKSVYAACATPIIMSLLVERADAAQSWNPGRGNLIHPGTGRGGPFGGAPGGPPGGPGE